MDALPGLERVIEWPAHNAAARSDATAVTHDTSNVVRNLIGWGRCATMQVEA